MRMLVLAALATTAFAATMMIDRTDANAVGLCPGVCIGQAVSGRMVLSSCTVTGTVIELNTSFARRGWVVRLRHPNDPDGSLHPSLSLVNRV